MYFSLSESTCASEVFKNILFTKVPGLSFWGISNLVRCFRSKTAKWFPMVKPMSCIDVKASAKICSLELSLIFTMQLFQ